MSSEKGWRGGEQQLAYLIEDLTAKNVQNFLAVKPGCGLENFSRVKRIPCYSVEFSNSLDLISALKIKKICRHEQIDLIHLHSSKAQGVGVLSAVCGNKIPMVLSRRVAFLPGKNIFSKWKYNKSQIKKILCVSEKVTTIMKAYITDASKCVTIYSGIDLKKFDHIKKDVGYLLKEFELHPDRLTILTVGAIDKSKDHFTFVDTIEKLVLAGHAVQGLVVGSGTLASQLEDYIRAKQMGSHVRLAGQRKDVGRLLLAADFFLMTSQEEGLGTSLLDAFLARLPVVATDAGGIPEIVRNMETGLLAPVGDSSKLSEQLGRLLVDPALRQKLVDQAYRFVGKFAKEETSSKTLKVYQEVLNQ